MDQLFTVEDRNLYIESSDFRNNNGTAPIDIMNGHVVIKDCKISHNQRPHDPEQIPLCGSISLVNCSATIENCDIFGNNVTVRCWTGINNGAVGGVHISDSSVVMNNTNIEGNVAFGMGGFIGRRIF